MYIQGCQWDEVYGYGERIRSRRIHGKEVQINGRYVLSNIYDKAACRKIGWKVLYRMIIGRLAVMSDINATDGRSLCFVDFTSRQFS